MQRPSNAAATSTPMPLQQGSASASLPSVFKIYAAADDSKSQLRERGLSGRHGGLTAYGVTSSGCCMSHFERSPSICSARNAASACPRARALPPAGDASLLRHSGGASRRANAAGTPSRHARVVAIGHSGEAGAIVAFLLPDRAPSATNHMVQTSTSNQGPLSSEERISVGDRFFPRFIRFYPCAT
jgi:hypothetical protein